MIYNQHDPQGEAASLLLHGIVLKALLVCVVAAKLRAPHLGFLEGFFSVLQLLGLVLQASLSSLQKLLSGAGLLLSTGHLLSH